MAFKKKIVPHLLVRSEALEAVAMARRCVRAVDGLLARKNGPLV